MSEENNENKHVPVQPANSYRVVLDVRIGRPRIDATLLTALRAQNDNLDLREISRSALKDLFGSSRIFIKGQRAKSSSTLATGLTYVDIIGFQ